MTRALGSNWGFGTSWSPSLEHAGVGRLGPSLLFHAKPIWEGLRADWLNRGFFWPWGPRLGWEHAVSQVLVLHVSLALWISQIMERGMPERVLVKSRTQWGVTIAWIQGKSWISAARSTTGSLYLFFLRQRNLLPWMHPLCHSIVLFPTNITAKQMYPWLFHKCKHKQNFFERCNSGFSGQICLTVRTTYQLHFSHNKGV